MVDVADLLGERHKLGVIVFLLEAVAFQLTEDRLLLSRRPVLVKVCVVPLLHHLTLLLDHIVGVHLHHRLALRVNNPPEEVYHMPVLQHRGVGPLHLGVVRIGFYLLQQDRV